MGIYKVPLDIGARISTDKAIEFSNYFEKIYLVCFKNEEYEYYCKYLKEKLIKVQMQFDEIIENKKGINQV